MSAGTPGQATQQAIGDMAIGDVDAFFQRVAKVPVQARLKETSGTCRFDIGSAGSWQVAIKEGATTVKKVEGDAKPPADCVISTSAEDFGRVVRREGHMNMATAILQERATVVGDSALALNILGSTVLEPAG